MLRGAQNGDSSVLLPLRSRGLRVLAFALLLPRCRTWQRWSLRPLSNLWNDLGADGGFPERCDILGHRRPHIRCLVWRRTPGRFRLCPSRYSEVSDAYNHGHDSYPAIRGPHSMLLSYDSVDAGTSVAFGRS